MTACHAFGRYDTQWAESPAIRRRHHGYRKRALDALLHEARDVAAIAAGNGERDDLLAGDGNSITAWRRMKELATQIRHTCGTFSAYCREGSPTTRRAVQRVLRRLRTAWPTAGTSFQGDPPWPTSSAARLKWLAAFGHRIWLPTAAQRADRWLEVHGDAELQERRCTTDPRSG